MKHLAIAAAALVLAGCQTHDNVLTGPQLSPVGEGIMADRQPLPVSFAEQRRTSFQSLWASGDKDLFSDSKARRVGDVVTVNISIDDKAQFENDTERSRKSGSSFGFGAGLGWSGFGVEGQSGEASGDFGFNSATSSAGQGSVGRSEKLRLSIAAIVTEELANGNLLISGSQEVKVNNEVRVLSIAGIVRPSDISTDNSIAYDKIAEARIAYGGRGRLNDVQQPAWGQRVYDVAAPF